MIRRLLRMPGVLVLVCMLCGPYAGLSGWQSVKAQAETPARPVVPQMQGDSGIVTDADGNRSRQVEGDERTEAAAPSGAQTDKFGYTWAGWPQNWIDARDGGTQTGWTGFHETAVGPFALPFPFKYYENTYTQFWIASGYIAFQPSARWDDQPDIPSPADPNNIIAPYAAPLGINLNNVTHQIYYKSGGAAPDRYLAVEWYKVQQGMGSDPVSDFTFEVVLYESGDIMFQYLGMNYRSNSRWCAASGIEDSSGFDGLNIENSNCARVDSDHGIYIDRPAPSARVLVEPPSLGRFTQANTQELFEFVVRNTGELGADVYNLAWTSDWPVTLSDAIGVPLRDTNADGEVDTGSIPQAGRRTIRVGVKSPVYINLGNTNLVNLVATSTRNTAKQSSARISTSFAAPFAQAYIDDGAGQGDVKVQFQEPGMTRSSSSAVAGSMTTMPAITALPGGGVFELWNQYIRGDNNLWADELFGAVYNAKGVLVQPARRLTRNSGLVDGSVWSSEAAIAATPDGHIGILWPQWKYRRSDGAENVNILFLVLNGNGAPVYGPINLTNNNLWGDSDSANWSAFYVPRLVATHDNHFLGSWVREDSRDQYWYDNIFYTALTSAGNVVKGVTRYTDVYSADRAGYHTLAQLHDGRILLLYDGIQGIKRALFDTSGNLLAGEVHVANEEPFWSPDSAVLADGHVLVAWLYWNDATGHNEIYTMALDAGSLSVMAGPAPFATSVTLSGDAAPSVTQDQDGHGIVTWTEASWDMQRWMYYALVDQFGVTLTEPMRFVDASKPASGVPYLMTSMSGYGNAPYRAVEPTTDGQDAYVKTSILAVGAPGGVAPIFLEVGNLGREPLVGASLTVSMTGGLAFADSNPAPDGVALADAAEVTWSLPDLDFQGVGRIVLYVRIPDVEIGTRFFVGASLNNTFDNLQENNQTSLRVMAAEQVHLPELKR